MRIYEKQKSYSFYEFFETMEMTFFDFLDLVTRSAATRRWLLGSNWVLAYTDLSKGKISVCFAVHCLTVKRSRVWIVHFDRTASCHRSSRASRYDCSIEIDRRIHQRGRVHRSRAAKGGTHRVRYGVALKLPSSQKSAFFGLTKARRTAMMCGRKYAA